MRFFILFILLTLSSCSRFSPFLYQQDIAQGNVFLPEQLAAVRESMPREDVRRILGTPQINDNFRPNEDIYLYRYFSGDTKKTYQSKLIIRYIDGRVISINHEPIHED